MFARPKLLGKSIGEIAPTLPHHFLLHHRLTVDFKNESALVEIKLVIYVTLHRPDVQIHFVITGSLHLMFPRHDRRRIVSQIKLAARHLTRLPNFCRWHRT